MRRHGADHQRGQGYICSKCAQARAKRTPGCGHGDGVVQLDPR